MQQATQKLTLDEGRIKTPQEDYYQNFVYLLCWFKQRRWRRRKNEKYGR